MTTKRILMKAGLPTCPDCGYHGFEVCCQELIVVEVDTDRTGDEWAGTHEHIENVGKHPYVSAECLGCREDLRITASVESYLKSIGG